MDLPLENVNKFQLRCKVF